jgi:hypothetical protein
MMPLLMARVLRTLFDSVTLDDISLEQGDYIMEHSLRR